MSQGTTYSRTSGAGILPGTWQAVLARYPGQRLTPQERLSWDAATDSDRAEFLRLAALPLTRPPAFLRFDLAANPYAPWQYPAAVPATQGMPSDGHLRGGQSPAEAATLLGISEDRLAMELAKFHGPVDVIKLLPGQKLYRTVVLTAKTTRYGSVTNRILGDYWESNSPNIHPSLDAWRRATAVLAEWNGDYGYLEVTLEREIVVLS